MIAVCRGIFVFGVNDNKNILILCIVCITINNTNVSKIS